MNKIEKEKIKKNKELNLYKVIKKAQNNLNKGVDFNIEEIKKQEIISPLDACTCTGNCYCET